MTMKDYYTNISHSKTQFLDERNLRSTLFYLYSDLQTILRFHRNTVNSQLQSHVKEHSDLRTLKNNNCLTSRRKVGGRNNIRLKESLHSIVSFWHNFEKQIIELPSCFVQFLSRRH